MMLGGYHSSWWISSQMEVGVWRFCAGTSEPANVNVSGSWSTRRPTKHRRQFCCWSGLDGEEDRARRAQRPLQARRGQRAHEPTRTCSDRAGSGRGSVGAPRLGESEAATRTSVDCSAPPTKCACPIENAARFSKSQDGASPFPRQRSALSKIVFGAGLNSSPAPAVTRSATTASAHRRARAARSAPRTRHVPHAPHRVYDHRSSSAADARCRRGRSRDTRALPGRDWRAARSACRSSPSTCERGARCAHSSTGDTAW